MHFLQNERIEGQKTTYTIIKALDNGSQGFVYLVKGDDEKFYALKRILWMKEGEMNFLKIYFQNQIEFQCLLTHYEYFKNKNSLIIIQEYCTRGNLYQLLQKKQKLSSQEISKILIDICRQLQILRNYHFFHRDLKPENILIQQDQNSGRNRYKLCDFGEIKNDYQNKPSQIQQNRCFQTINVGTPYYQAPEVIKSGVYDGSADIWSLGTLIYELYTNQILFNGITISEIQSKILAVQRDQNTLYNQIDQIQIENKYKILLKKMLSYNPQERPTIEDVQRVYSIEKAIDFETTKLTVSNIKIQQFKIDDQNFKQPKVFPKFPLQFYQGNQEFQQNYQNFNNFQQNQINQLDNIQKQYDFSNFKNFQINQPNYKNNNQQQLASPQNFKGQQNSTQNSEQMQQNYQNQNQLNYKFDTTLGQFKQNFDQFNHKPYQLPLKINNPQFQQDSLNFSQNQFKNQHGSIDIQNNNISQHFDVQRSENQNCVEQQYIQQSNKLISPEQNSLQLQQQQDDQNIASKQQMLNNKPEKTKKDNQQNQLDIIIEVNNAREIDQSLEQLEYQKKIILNEQIKQKQIDEINQKIKQLFNIPSEIIEVQNQEDINDLKYQERIRDYLLKQMVLCNRSKNNIAN